ncbi:hypothetical protein G6F50_017681 [Rhizopus delemar]|uniref:Uncharacterized protein n=1 Tax=Rhizopus delemar TaxID=936053 RepID=A0A9P6XPC1_9FUNG|nr:hypothetical protein G6F23_014170 [Rhizopus arrhizus]KAG1529902.1 hypothetical protein G6F50_017681 [Rhizopus delemar]
MTEAKSATSGTDRAKPPTVSRDSARLFTPARGTAPNVGLKPTMPQYEAGRMMEPAVCEPSAKGTMSSATAAADPLDEPPGV